MGEAYWITGVNLCDVAPQENPVQRLLALLSSAATRPAALDEIHVLGCDGDRMTPTSLHEAGFSVHCPIFTWQPHPLYEHANLHSLTRAIELEERQTVLLIRQQGQLFSAVLLASARAVGRHNLNPRTRIKLRVTLPTLGDEQDDLYALERALIRSGLRPGDVEWMYGMCAEEKHCPARIDSLPVPRPRSDAPAPFWVTWALNELSGAMLEGQPGRLGLLYSFFDSPAGYATVLEQV